MSKIKSAEEILNDFFPSIKADPSASIVSVAKETCLAAMRSYAEATVKEMAGRVKENENRILTFDDHGNVGMDSGTIDSLASDLINDLKAESK